MGPDDPSTSAPSLDGPQPSKHANRTRDAGHGAQSLLDTRPLYSPGQRLPDIVVGLAVAIAEDVGGAESVEMASQSLHQDNMGWSVAPGAFFG